MAFAPVWEAAFVCALERKEATEKEISEKVAGYMLLKDQLVRAINLYACDWASCALTMRHVAAKP